MKKGFIKTTCQINNKVGRKVYSAARCNGHGGSRHKTKSSLHFWKELYTVMLDRKVLNFYSKDSFYKAVYFRIVLHNCIQLSNTRSIFTISFFHTILTAASQAFISLRSYFRHSLVRTLLSALISYRKEFRKIFFWYSEVKLFLQNALCLFFIF